MAFGDLLQATSRNQGGADQPVAYTSNVTGGSLLIAYFDGVPADTMGVIDSRSNSWTVARRHNSAGIGAAMAMYYAIANSSGACTVTASSTGGMSFTIIAEYAGPFLAAPLDQVNSAEDAAAGNPDSGNILPTVDGALLLGGLYGANTLTVTGTGWTTSQSEAGFNDSQLLTRRLQTTAATDSARATQTSGYWIALVADFMPLPPGTIGGGGQTMFRVRHRQF